jgi:hypothetical protein
MQYHLMKEIKDNSNNLVFINIHPTLDKYCQN